MPASFNDLPTEIKLLIVDWAHAMDEAAEARQRMDPQRRWDSVRECWIHRAKGAGRCNVLFRLDRELSEMAAPRVFQSFNLNRTSPKHSIIEDTILSRYKQHITTIRIVTSDVTGASRYPRTSDIGKQLGTIQAVEVEHPKDLTNSSPLPCTYVINLIARWSRILGPFPRTVPRLHLAWMPTYDTIHVVGAFHNIQHLKLSGPCLWDRPRIDTALVTTLAASVSRMKLKSLELDRSDGNGRGGTHFHPAWYAQDWTHRTELESLVIRAPRIRFEDWKIVDSFASTIATLRLEFSFDISTRPNYVSELVISPFPRLSNLTLVGSAAEVLVMLDQLAASPLKHLSLALTVTESLQVRLLLAAVQTHFQCLTTLDCSIVNTESLPPLDYYWLGDTETEAMVSGCKEGKIRYTCAGRAVEDWSEKRRRARPHLG